ncbi:tRNA (adenosine(37)-N6)-threonylcarbamoyltransferase complex dimerization subunit type 1 TsaB [Dokdonia sp. Hel_I_53]|uniref:tRNA (adenosine(37)-N6)-threonylcarbamoyltransferase complex dimerization subunit type 1 TsaB n=1 Tax=Dokdonia sp. Hel_I_53 TaxID=1566287 RepID=UPI00119A2C33|nr:tRNA (adenosine(37)-N6)-threonylcarbamoyltransferase complex dimerization subunit type 1 TsaB [Dokdonia sp. Hel_I_53]TVZ52215.1 tRNA threonylcarbamoyladenosine biosynthesis protein TsaB [Dokdonia sp. Hel_I_53]
MGYILNLETATTNCSVALSMNGQVVAYKEDNAQKYSHAERLHIYIEEVLASAKVDKAQLCAVAVSKGPGSYTGLRIGVSAAKGLSYALDIPLIAVETLQSLSVKVNISKDELVVPMLDARRMEVYSAIYDHQGTRLRQTEAQILEDSSFDKELSNGLVYFIGNGVSKFKEVCTSTNARFLPDELPSAVQLAVLAQEKFEAKDFEDLAYFEPYYLKDFIAGKPSAN